MSKERTPIAELYRNLIHAINRTGDGLQPLPELPSRWYVTEPSPGTYVILEEVEEGLVRLSNKRALAAAVAKFLETPAMIGMSDFLWTAKQLDGFVDLWAYSSRQIAMPSSWGWADDLTKTFHRLPWVRGEEGETPTWDALLGRMGANAGAFMQWVGSLFFSESDRQQYVWLYGQGGDGKGCILRFLNRVFGPAYASKTVPGKDDKFWTYGLLGKRICAFPDTNNAGFPASGLFKSLTGNDAVGMEIKGGASFSASIETKFIFASNERPTLTSEKSDMRRPILVDFESVEGPADPAYEQRLYDEGGAFLTKAIALYREQCPNHEQIVTCAESLENWVGSLEDVNATVFAEHFSYIPGAETPDTLFTQTVQFAFSRNRKEAREFKKYIERKYGIRRSTPRRNVHVYINVAIKTRV